MGPKSNMTGVLIWTQTRTQGERHVEVEAETGVRLQEAKERRQSQKQRGAWNRLAPPSAQKEPTLPTP